MMTMMNPFKINDLRISETTQSAEKCRKAENRKSFSAHLTYYKIKELDEKCRKRKTCISPPYIYIYYYIYPYINFQFFIVIKVKSFSANVCNSMKTNRLGLPKKFVDFLQLKTENIYKLIKKQPLMCAEKTKKDFQQAPIFSAFGKEI
ncbi:MAG: hypothetical protein CH6_0079 [Candidatus Kapaibacterium sp.]|nr:MAG: hypothetical protein CH6_0079 [Candidatus Kapabacteria bacterium]